MVARITFRSELYLEGESLQEIKSKFENLPIYDIKGIDGDKVYDYGFCEIVSVEDPDDNYKDITSEFNILMITQIP